ncbi:hypothetical protein H7B90_18665 [Cohnella xylanilytica]|uniref:Uncharacterized protein n=1 Tax=Cohnella xylanilytica TaxID=557555 RepID=A0A841TYR9_9BACL|nr:hypothetical protein [Cohnella xylanilytica]MBB6693416.1 hypothetical protein [Cohnella xylanilytica]
MQLYFRDNFFNSGVTEILDASERDAGYLDLKSAFGSSLDVYGPGGELACSGKFGFFSSRWNVTDAEGRELGQLRWRMALFSKKYTYEAYGRGEYDFVSPAFSQEYDVLDSGERSVARFERVSGWFSSGAFRLDNFSEELDSYELVAVIMGVHALQKAASTAAT